jgi:acyl-CoA reductase-like NAD-dependent aldehyde dehydrogenase
VPMKPNVSLSPFKLYVVSQLILYLCLDGLYASVFSSNINTALRVARALEAGNVGINCTSPYGAYDLPFGGFKASGIGRQKGSNAVAAWLEEKSVFIRQEAAMA